MLELIGGLIGLATFIFATWQYKEAQNWKRAEFLAAEIKFIRRDPSNFPAFIMLDWHERQIVFSDKIYNFEDRMLLKALRFHIQEDYMLDFPPPQAQIRDSFDHLLEDIERINSFVRANLIKIDNVRPYFGYWLDIMSGRNKRKSQDIIEQIWCYIDSYDYKGVRELFEKLGYIELPKVVQSGYVQRNKPPVAHHD